MFQFRFGSELRNDRFERPEPVSHSSVHGVFTDEHATLAEIRFDITHRDTSIARNLLKEGFFQGVDDGLELRTSRFGSGVWALVRRVRADYLIGAAS
ncbi:MAG: hypothetical protein J0I77_17790 [Rudaea sp.]|uniref:hypothetical protein n=1 Tax=unclassified Rudaea TaxID=2627037 RepID=UPI00148591E0|nr:MULTISPECIES: hypothetical protein [unclassified Rudaea]MBN8887581.1 hypothetical protein [Rudaea sp.]